MTRRHEDNGMADLHRELERKLLSPREEIDEHEWRLLLWMEVKDLGDRLARPPWTNWSPREIAIGIAAILAAIGGGNVVIAELLRVLAGG